MIPPNPQNQSMSSEDTDLLQFCKDLGVITEGRDK